MTKVTDIDELKAIPLGALFQDRRGAVWQKQTIKVAVEGQEYVTGQVYAMAGLSRPYAATQVIEFAPLVMITDELPVIPNFKMTREDAFLSAAVLQELGIKTEQETNG